MIFRLRSFLTLFEDIRYFVCEIIVNRLFLINFFIFLFSFLKLIHFFGILFYLIIDFCLLNYPVLLAFLLFLISIQSIKFQSFIFLILI